MRLLSFFPDAFDELLEWGEINKPILEKIKLLLKDILRNPFTGLGKPEPLKHGKYSGYWSRRITKEHRLVYRVTDSQIIIVSCKNHYS